MSKNKNLQTLLGARIAKLRKLQGYTQEKFAEKIGIAQRTLSCIETGVNFTQASTLEKIAKTLGLSAKELFNFDEDASNEELFASIVDKIKFIKNDTDKLRLVNDFLKKMF